MSRSTLAVPYAHAASHAPGGIDSVHAQLGHRDSSHITNIMRHHCVGATAVLLTGTGYASYFTPDIDLTATHLSLLLNVVASGLTNFYYGIYTATNAGTLTTAVLAQQDAFANSFANISPGNAFNGSLVEYIITMPSTTFARGTRYAVMLMAIGTTGPRLVGINAAISGAFSSANFGPVMALQTAAGQSGLLTAPATPSVASSNIALFSLW